jgi:F420-dependent oxidoreductase-like protein
MKLATGAGYWSAGPPAGALDAIKEAEALGYDSFWTAEAYGSDALTPLAWWGASTERIKLGTGIIQMSARTPTATAMAAITLDHLSGGRFICGIGASGPQVVEGWYGQPYPKPLARTREYVSIMRQVFAREAPVAADGAFYQLPYQGGARLGKALKPTVHPLRSDIPVYLAAEGPKNVALSAEICDGWLPLFFSPDDDSFYRTALQSGFDAAGKGTLGAPDGPEFEVVCPVSVVPIDDINKAADMVRPMLALYMGGMGAKGANFHHEVFCRMGYEDVADTVQTLYMEGRKAEASAAIPVELVEKVALIGPIDKIKDDLAQWEESVVTTMMVSGPPQVMRLMAELCL